MRRGKPGPASHRIQTLPECAHPGLKWRELGWALVPPALYASYALARGAIDGWYAYWFLNPAEQGIGPMLVSLALLLGVVAAIAAVLIAVDRWLGRPE